MSIQNNFPAIKPTLLLDFANTEALDPRITFTRASTATYYGTQTAKAEENLLLQSQAFETASWTKQASGAALAPVVTANHAAAPDGTTTAERVEFSLNSGTATADLSWLNQTVTITSGLDATFSIWLRSTDGTSSYAMQIISPTGAGSAITVTGAWTRVTITAASAGANTYGVRLRGGQTPTNANTADILVWGAQLEQRDAVTAYTPTTTQPIINYIPVLETAASGVARFDHSPATFESLGLLIEEQRTNLVTYSAQFDNAAWTKSNSTITANTVIAPDGTLTGDKLVEDTATAAHQVIRIITATSGVTYTATIYAKKAEVDVLTIDYSGSLLGTYNLTTGVATLGAGNANSVAVSASMTSVGNEWYRCSMTFTRAGATIDGSYRFSLRQYTSYTGDGYSGIYIWGAQVEAAAFPTSYIPTVASEVTRSADAASMTGANFSSWYNQAEGTMYADALRVKIPVSANTTLADINDGTTANRIRFWVWSGATSTLRFTAVVNGANQADLSLGTLSSGVAFKAAGAYRVNDFAGALNAGTVLTDTSGSVPSVLFRFDIGNAGATGEAFNGTLRKIAYYPIRCTNAQLQGLTS